MLSSKRKLMRPAHVIGPVARTGILALAVVAGGCSADVTRFDFGQTTSSIPVPPEPVRGGYSSPASYPRNLGGVAEAPLPPAAPEPSSYRTAARDYGPPPSGMSDSPSPRYAAAPEPFREPPPSRFGSAEPSYQAAPSEPPGNYRVVGRQYNTPSSPGINNAPPRVAALPPERSFDAPPAAGAGGQAIEVQQGETLYSIGRRYGVSVDALKQANGLSSNIVRPGERLVLPAGPGDRGPTLASVTEPERAPVPSREPSPSADPATPPRLVAAEAPAAASDAPPGWTGRYTMRAGETLSSIALRHNVTLAELKRANGISDTARLAPGTVLTVPVRSYPTARGETGAPRIVQVPARPVTAMPEAAPAPAPERKVASRGDIANDAEPSGAEEIAAGKFRWPVKGKVIAGFGRRPDGTHNDGVNLAVPHGTEIQAAEAGKVVYAGNELKGYGNLVLIRHANGYVTAYAHADRLLAKAGDEVRRGQVIATAGRTGAVDQPQLHFELRQGSKPIDPLPHMTN